MTDHWDLGEVQASSEKHAPAASPCRAVYDKTLRYRNSVPSPCYFPEMFRCHLPLSVSRSTSCRLKLFLHVSSCYVNGNQPQGSEVQERLYPLVLNGKRVDHAVSGG